MATRAKVGDEGPTCRGPQCDRPVRTVGLCNAHYRQHITGGELRPLSSMGQKYRPGDQVYHRQRSCKFVSSASRSFLMIAACLREHGEKFNDMQWIADVAGRCTSGPATVMFIVYDDDGSIGMVPRTALRRHPRERSQTHWYAQEKAKRQPEGAT